MPESSKNPALALFFAIASVGVSIYASLQSGQANETANEANEIADDALRQNEMLQRDNQDFARRMQQYEISLTTPRLVLLRFKRLSATRYVATIQNDGQRQAVIFGAHLHRGPIEAAMGSMGERPTVPESMKVQTIKIPFDDPDELTVDLPIPAVVDAGDIVSIDITFTEQFTEGDIYIDQGIGQSVRAGRYRVRQATDLVPVSPASSSRELDDLFGSPPPPAPGFER